MEQHIAYIIPEATVPEENVPGGKKTLVMRSRLGTEMALGTSPHVNILYSIEGQNHFKNSKKFYKEVSKAMKGKTPSEIENAVIKFSSKYGYTPTKLIRA